MRVRPAEAEAAHACEASAATASPVAPARRDLKRRVGGRKARVEVADVQMWRDVFALKGERDFDKAGDPRSRFKVADIGLDGADVTTRAARPPLAQDGAEGGELDGIAERRARAVRLDVTDSAGGDARLVQRLSDERLLRQPVRGRQPVAPPVLIDGRAADRAPPRGRRPRSAPRAA